MPVDARNIQLANLRTLVKKARSRQSTLYTLNATKKRTSISARLFRNAYQKNNFVAWRTSFVPSEILFPLGIIPFPAETVIAMFASSNIAAEILGIAEEKHCSRDICSFLRGTIGASAANILPTPDFLICTSLYCDGSAKTFYSLGKKYNKPVFFIDIPYDYNLEYSVSYVAQQLESIMKKMAKIMGVAVDYNKLSQSIRNANEARNYFEAALRLRQIIPSPMLGGEAIDYAVMLSHLWGSEDAVVLYKMLYDELKERVDSNISALDTEKYRILWRQLRPYYTDKIFRYLELENNALIAFEEANYLHWEEMDPETPFISLAKKLLANPPLGPFQRWLDLTFTEGIEKYKIDGIIEFAQWGCRHLNSGTQILRERLRDADVPILVLDGDCVDKRDYSWAQIKTRIDTFLEILERKKRR
jgi:benzoyl-CoA reductase/2-hydroxyglutaryl-CoA dehydratase subunit BcrC/BadD/HgdB